MNPLDAAREHIKEALAPHFSGKTAEKRLDSAATDVLNAVAHLITTRDEVKKNPLGATVMTEKASSVKAPGIVPRTI